MSLLAQFWPIPTSPWEQLRVGPGHWRGCALAFHDSAAHLLPASSTPTSPALSFQAFISSSHCYSSVHLNILILGEGGTGEQHPPPASPATFPGLSAETRARLSPASMGETNRGRGLKQGQHLPPCAWRGLGKERREGAREAACNYRVRGSDKMIMEEF